MAKVRQIFNQPTVKDVPGAIKEQLSERNLAERVKPGQRIAVTAGSRGIANITLILRTVVEEFKAVFMARRKTAP